MIRDQLHIDEQGIGWRIVQAVSFEAAEQAIAQAKVTGSTGHTDTVVTGLGETVLAEVKRDVPQCTCSWAIGTRHSPHCTIFAYEVANDERAGRLPARMLANMLPGRLAAIGTATEQAQLARDAETYCKVVEAVMPPVRKLRGRLIFPGLPPFELPTFDTDCKVIDEAHTPASRSMRLSVEMKLTDKSRESLRRFARQLMGKEKPPLIDVLPSWETDEFGDDREVWHGRMRIVRNRKRMRKLKRRGVMFMDLRAKTGNKHPDGYEGPRAWAWFTPHPADLAHRELMHEIKDLTAEEVFGDVPAGTTEGDVCPSK
jgi:hypothetical protein